MERYTDISASIEYNGIEAAGTESLAGVLEQCEALAHISSILLLILPERTTGTLQVETRERERATVSARLWPTRRYPAGQTPNYDYGLAAQLVPTMLALDLQFVRRLVA